MKRKPFDSPYLQDFDPGIGSDDCSIYVVSIGSARAPGARTGIAKTYLVPGTTKNNVVKNLFTFVQGSIEHVRSIVKDSAFENHEYVIEKDRFDPETYSAEGKKRQIAENKAFALELLEERKTLPMPTAGEIKIALLTGKPLPFQEIEAEVKRLDEENDLLEMEIYKLLQPRKEIASEFGIVVKNLHQLVDWLSKGWYTVELVAKDQITPVSYFDDWRGYIAYCGMDFLKENEDNHESGQSEAVGQCEDPGSTG